MRLQDDDFEYDSKSISQTPFIESKMWNLSDNAYSSPFSKPIVNMGTPQTCASSNASPWVDITNDKGQQEVEGFVNRFIIKKVQTASGSWARKLNFNEPAQTQVIQSKEEAEEANDYFDSEDQTDDFMNDLLSTPFGQSDFYSNFSDADQLLFNNYLNPSSWLTQTKRTQNEEFGLFWDELFNIGQI